jgi:hypothetical protein
MAPVGFWFDPDQSQSRSGSPVAGAATMQQRRAASPGTDMSASGIYT